MSVDKNVMKVGSATSGWQLFFCVTGGLVYGLIACMSEYFVIPSLVIVSLFTLLAISKIGPVMQQRRFTQMLTRPIVKVLNQEKLIALTKKSQEVGDRWMGFGFQWEVGQRQQAEEFASTNWHSFFEKVAHRAMVWRYVKQHWRECLLSPFESLQALEQQKRRVAQVPGFPWIHLLGEEKPFYVTGADLAGHMLIVGTTGAGKSRFLEHQITQAILKGNTVIVLDPKGDKVLEANMQEACRMIGKADSFIRIHLGHPENSYGIDLLANYSRIGELASRLADTIPGQGGEGQVFVDMGRSVLRTILEGIEIIGEKPTFKRLHHYFLHRRELAERALKAYLSSRLGEDVINAQTRAKGVMASYKTLKDAYQQSLAYDPRIESVIALAERDPENLMKTTVSTFNLLENLVRGDLGEMLTPDVGNARLFTDSRRLVSQNAVIYVGLDALSDSQLASSIGSMFLSDLAATAGARYNFDVSPSPVSLFVDEAAELMCEPFVQMLNKSRGAGFSICLATQTVADFVAKAGNKQAEAMRVLANLNNFVALRCNDQETQEFVVNRVPKVQVETTMFSHNVSVSADRLTTQAGNLGERSQLQEVDLIPAQLLGALPNFEFFAIVAGAHVMKGRIPLLDLQTKNSEERIS